MDYGRDTCRILDIERRSSLFRRRVINVIPDAIIADCRLGYKDKHSEGIVRPTRSGSRLSQDELGTWRGGRSGL